MKQKQYYSQEKVVDILKDLLSNVEYSENKEIYRALCQVLGIVAEYWHDSKKIYDELLELNKND